MEAKEKAKALVQEHYLQLDWIEHTYNVNLYLTAKQLALKSVDEIIKALDSIKVSGLIDWHNHYEQVRKEIKKL